MAQSDPRHQRRALYRLAGEQGDVISTGQLYELGYSFEDIRRMVRQGVLHRLHPGVYSVGLPGPGVYGRLHAALLAGGPDSFLSHRSAPAEWDLWQRYGRLIHVTVPGTSTRKARDGIVFHRTTDLSGIVTRHRLHVSSLERMLIELSPTESPKTLTRLIERAINRRHFDAQKLDAALTAAARRPGLESILVAARSYRDHPDRTKWLEGEFRAYQETHPEIPEPVYNYRGERPWEIDVAWPELKVCLELDGRPYHEVITTLEKDHRKTTRLQLVGWRPMRVTDVTWEYDRDTVIAETLAMLAVAARAR